MTPRDLAVAAMTCSIDVVGDGPVAGDVLGLVQGHFAQALLDGLQRHVHGEEPAHLVFVQQQHAFRGNCLRGGRKTHVLLQEQ